MLSPSTGHWSDVPMSIIGLTINRTCWAWGNSHVLRPQKDVMMLPMVLQLVVKAAAEIPFIRWTVSWTASIHGNAWSTPCWHYDNWALNLLLILVQCHCARSRRCHLPTNQPGVGQIDVHDPRNQVAGHVRRASQAASTGLWILQARHPKGENWSVEKKMIESRGICFSPVPIRWHYQPFTVFAVQVQLLPIPFGGLSAKGRDCAGCWWDGLVVSSVRNVGCCTVHDQNYPIMSCLAGSSL